VVAGDTLEAAVFAAEELEETAKLYLMTCGMNPRMLTPDQVAELVSTFKIDVPGSEAEASAVSPVRRTSPPASR